ncbi:hypothetical protein JOD57_000029 [Geodermatophilus bullaregiensis]|uniref:hypothetical protein n=1 Tax=Geodermatophilus bullaregiensis TaxID=1564160 RepID=UPI00195634FA|nr:hypothetical protein [Geodermatophilus bullaregiensis]MBM7804192.1 hypothetical protein [Geodermatophilus bullaregiensis]
MACGNHDVSARTVRLLGRVALAGGGSHRAAYANAVSHGLQGIARTIDQAQRVAIADQQRARSQASVEEAERAIASASSKSEISSALRDAQRALLEVRRSGGDRQARDRAVRALEQKVGKLLDTAKIRQAEIDQQGQYAGQRSSIEERPSSVLDRLAPINLGMRPPSATTSSGEQSVWQGEVKAPSRSAMSAVDAVLASRAVPLDIAALLEPALRNAAIPQYLRDELPAAMEKIQAVTSHAPGIATEHIAGLELGRSSRGHGGTVWVSTVAGSGQVHGYAYEIIAASRFIDEAKTPGNGGNPVRINQGSDELIFGQKLPSAPGRRTVEADILVVKGDGHKIGIDSKNYSRAFGPSEDLRSQLEGVKEAIRQGEVHEYHFAVRGRITQTAKDLIQQADIQVRAELRGAHPSSDPTISELQSRSVDVSLPVICWHEDLG